MGEANELVREPRYRVRLTAAGGVLEKVPLARTVLSGVSEQLPDDIQLMIAREDLIALHVAGPRVLPFDDLSVILKDIRQPRRREHALPEEVRLEPCGIGRIAGAVVPALIERQKPGCLALEVRAEAHLG